VIRLDIRIVDFDAAKYDLERYENIHLSPFKVGFLVYQDNKLIHTAWFTNESALFKGLDSYLDSFN
jgi:hypothetical protein